MERFYPEDCFPAVRNRIDGIIAEGRFLISDEVWEEIQKRDAVVKAWCQPRLAAIVAATDRRIATAVQQILTKYPRLTMSMKGRNRADPFVIAVAMVHKAVVVTGEANTGTEARPRIPYVCSELTVPCTSFLELIRTEGWTF
jgi:hypothetical protein